MSADVSQIEGWVALELLGHRTLHSEEEARGEVVRARQVLDDARGQRAGLEKRRVATTSALDLIRERDQVSEATIEALMKRGGSPVRTVTAPPPPPATADIDARMAALEERLAPGHETTCTGCGTTIVRVLPPARGLVSRIERVRP